MRDAAYLQPYSGTVIPFVSQTQIDQHNGHDGPLFRTGELSLCD